MPHDTVGVLVRLGASAVGASLGGPLGAWCCGLAGSLLTQESTQRLATLLNGGTATFQSLASNYCYDRLKELLYSQPNPPLHDAVQVALRQALAKAARNGHEDWFNNWQRRLNNGPFLFQHCGVIYRSFLAHRDESGVEAHAIALRQLHLDLMLRLDFEARAMDGGIPAEREMPEALHRFVCDGLPSLVDAELTLVFASEIHKAAWIAAERSFHQHVTAELADVKAMVALVLANQANQLPSPVIERLERELAGTKLELEQVRKKAEEYLQQYVNLLESLRRHPDDPSSAEVERLIEKGEFERAGEILDKVIAEEAGELLRLARRRFERGKLHLMQFQPEAALEHYRRALELAPEDWEIQLALAGLLSVQQRFSEAVRLFEGLRGRFYLLAASDSEQFQPLLAVCLNKLATLYNVTQRLREAEQAYNEALGLIRELARANPEAYAPYLAGTLNDLAGVYNDTQCMREAEKAYNEALGLIRERARANPDAYSPDLARTLNNLAGIYRDTQRMREAEKTDNEALGLIRELARANPEAYSSDLARTLNNLATLYKDTQRMREAEEAYDEALGLIRELARANPDAYAPELARTLNNLAYLYSTTRRMREAEKACSEAREILRPLYQAHPQVHGGAWRSCCSLWVRLQVIGIRH